MLLDRQPESEARPARAEQAARALGHPQTLAFVLLFRMLPAQLRDDPAEVLRVHDELATLCAEKDIAQERLWARPVVGWALFATGQLERGLAQISAGLDEQDAKRNALLRPYYLQLLADMLLKSDRVDAAIAVLESAKFVGRDTDQQMFAPEWHRLRGIAFQTRGQLDDVQAAFDDALEVARWQGAKLFEARARAARTPARPAPTNLRTP